jgi:hypothetical protein
MRSSRTDTALVVVIALLLTLLYPALFMNSRLSPEASLKSEPPWRVQWGPYPNPSPLAVDAATNLGPRLASIARDGLSVALWNPWIGGGRPGWLSSPAEGGAPLPLVAGLLAREGWAWTALLALELALAFASAWWVITLLGTGAWPAAVGATAYALSGPVVGHWLDWQGSALALGPLALLPVLAAPSRAHRRVAVWAIVLLVLAGSGAPAVPFIALAVALAILARPLLGAPARLGAPLAALAIVLLAALPALWLAQNGGEPGAPAPPLEPAPRVAGLRALVVPPPLPEGAAVSSVVRTPAYLGAATLLLALLGVVRLPSRIRGFWLGTLAVTVLLALLPGALLARAGISERPFGVMALATAVLAAFGTQMLCERVRSVEPRRAVGLAVWVLVVVALAPPAARRLPFARADEAVLPSPIPAGPQTQTTRIIGLLGILPPDVAATLGLADIRGASFPREPRYAALLGAGRGGELSVSRALDPRTARLSARWLLEPLPLRVVSGELFARIEPVELHPRGGRFLDGLLRFGADLPPGACRLGLPAPVAPHTVWLERPGLRSELDPDDALAAESDAWRWFAVPPGWPAGPSMLALPAGRVGSAAQTVAWDTSGLRVAREQSGVRLWEWDLARPLAFVATGLQPEDGAMPTQATVVTVPADRLRALASGGTGRGGRVEIIGNAPAHLELRVEAPEPVLLVAQIKHRPALWRAAVNGRHVATERADYVWTGIPVPAGVSHVALRAQVPLGFWLPACAGIVALASLGWPRRER